MKTLAVWLMLFGLAGVARSSGPTVLRILPSATDPAIKTFDTPHAVYVDREIVVDHKQGLPADRHELLLWLTGTGGKAAGAASAFCSLAANNGYHVISLMYPDEVPATVCRNDDDPRAFELFRMAIIEGGKTRHLAIDRPESIEGRLIALLRFLRDRRPKEDWGQFLTADGAIRWKSVAVAGQSQGGGHAALIGIKHEVTRVICTGAPKDQSKRLKAPAAWLGLDSATPKSRFFTFNHVQDSRGCTPQELLENVRVLGLLAFGDPVDVAREGPPYQNSRVLSTSYPKVGGDKDEGDPEKIAHTSVIANSHAKRWKDVWTHMLTTKVE